MTTDGDSEESGTHTQRPASGGAHQGPGRWARRGAERMGLPAGESIDAGSGAEPPTADSGDPDISPSLAGGHADATPPATF